MRFELARLRPPNVSFVFHMRFFGLINSHARKMDSQTRHDIEGVGRRVGQEPLYGRARARLARHRSHAGGGAHRPYLCLCTGASISAASSASAQGHSTQSRSPAPIQCALIAAPAAGTRRQPGPLSQRAACAEGASLPWAPAGVSGAGA